MRHKGRERETERERDSQSIRGTNERMRASEFGSSKDYGERQRVPFKENREICGLCSTHDVSVADPCGPCDQSKYHLFLLFRYVSTNVRFSAASEVRKSDSSEEAERPETDRVASL